MTSALSKKMTPGLCRVQTLGDLCANQVAKNLCADPPEATTTTTEAQAQVPNVFLPAHLCDKILKPLVESSALTDRQLYQFRRFVSLPSHDLGFEIPRSTSASTSPLSDAGLGSSPLEAVSPSMSLYLEEQCSSDMDEGFLSGESSDSMQLHLDEDLDAQEAGLVSQEQYQTNLPQQQQQGQQQGDQQQEQQEQQQSFDNLDQQGEFSPMQEHEMPLEERCRLRRLVIPHCHKVTNDGLAHVSSHLLQDIDLTGCVSITGGVFEALRNCSDTLISLSLASCTGIDSVAFAGVGSLHKLQTFNASNTMITEEGLRHLPISLVALNVARCAISDISSLYHLPSLVSLFLHDTDVDAASVRCLQNFPQLVSLDVASSSRLLLPEEQQQDLNEETFNAAVFNHLHTLRHLTWVNVSLTSAGDACIQGLIALPNLKFLGMVAVPAQAVTSVPDGVEIASLHSPDQLMNALRSFHNSSYILRILRPLFRFISRTCSAKNKEGLSELPATAADITSYVVKAMRASERSTDIQLVASAILFYMTADHIPHQESEGRLHALAVLLDCLDDHSECLQLVKNCCLTLRNFHTENELAFFSRPLATRLLEAANRYDDRTVQLTSMYLCCHNLASLHPWHKCLIGEAGGVVSAMTIIETKLECCLQVNPPNPQMQQDIAALEAGWTFLWNITDETPSNSMRVMEAGGLELMLLVLKKLPHLVTVRRNIMGLVTNIAEVPELRQHLMSRELLDDLRQTLHLDDLEVTYNTAGTLCHLISQGQQDWTDKGLPDSFWHQVLDDIATVVDSWDLNCERWINYRSLRPVICLLSNAYPWQVNYWACWALASLCTNNAPKYCEMCIKEAAVEGLVNLADVPSRVHETAAKVIDKCERWRQAQQS
eukprot:m.132643 g.132643  ORF g.132643 m.132643 type:complete len:885 (-) comp23778_c0_seq3:42-2696(-)